MFIWLEKFIFGSRISLKFPTDSTKYPIIKINDWEAICMFLEYLWEFTFWTFSVSKVTGTNGANFMANGEVGQCEKAERISSTFAHVFLGNTLLFLDVLRQSLLATGTIRGNCKFPQFINWKCVKFWLKFFCKKLIVFVWMNYYFFCSIDFPKCDWFFSVLGRHEWIHYITSAMRWNVIQSINMKILYTNLDSDWLVFWF